MDIDLRIKSLEDEAKLLKGEMKATMTNIRDFLVGMKVPPPVDQNDSSRPSPRDNNSGPQPQAHREKGKTTPEETEMAEGGKKPQQPKNRNNGGSLMDSLGTTMPLEDLAETAPPQSLSDLFDTPEQPPNKADNAQPEPPSAGPPPEPEEVLEEEVIQDGLTPPQAQAQAQTPAKNVNPLVSLIRWVETARREIGREQLPALLDVYSVIGPLPQPVRDTILRLGDLMSEPSKTDSPPSVQKLLDQQLAAFLEAYRQGGNEDIKNAIVNILSINELAARSSKADTWSRLILELHGIVGGNESLFTAEQPPAANTRAQEEEAARKAREEVRPIKIKLVLPVANGGEKEFSISLQPEEPEEPEEPKLKERGRRP